MRHGASVLVGILALLGGTAVAQDDGEDAVRKIRERISTMRITLDFANSRLEDVISYFQEYSGLNFHLDAEARTKLADEGARVTIKLKDVTLKTALKLILAPRDLACVYRDGVILVASKTRLGGETVTRVYDVRDLIFAIQDFPGPNFDLDTKKPGINSESFGLQEEPKTAFTEETLVDLIKTCTESGRWSEGNSASIVQINGLLIVTQTRSVHHEVRRLLDLLRQYK